MRKPRLNNCSDKNAFYYLDTVKTLNIKREMDDPYNYKNN